jgi:Uma2 family endonuclease
MGIGALLSEEEYLHTSYEPDCEFEDGVLIERNVGTEKHSWLQAALAAYFFQRRKLWNIQVYTEQRIKLRQRKYKIPDICVIRGSRPATPVLEEPPFLAIEILSPDDRPIRVNDTIDDWLNFGIPYIWIIDPETLESSLHTPKGRLRIENGGLRIPEAGIEVPLQLLDQEGE